MDKTYRSRYDNFCFDVHRLSNGIQVYIQKPQMVPDEEGALHGFLPFVGSCREKEGEEGTAHFFEHVPLDFARFRDLNNAGGNMNGSTGPLMTTYDFWSPKESFDLAARKLGQTLSDPQINEPIVARERGVIASEYRMKHSDPDYLIGKARNEAFLGKEHPLGHFPIGELEVIENMTVAKLQSFHRMYYHAGNIRIMCGGAFAEIDKERILDTLEGELSSFIPSEATPFSLSLPSYQMGKRMRVQNSAFCRDKLSMIYFSNERLSDGDRSCLSILDSLGSGAHSKLLEELREKRGWVYESDVCDHSTSRFWWEFSLNCHVQKERFPEVESIFYNFLKCIDVDDVEKKLSRWKLTRLTEWTHPVKACQRALNKIVFDGQAEPIHYWEELEDTLSPESVLAWRDDSSP